MTNPWLPILIAATALACKQPTPSVATPPPAQEGSWLQVQTTVVTPEGRTSTLQLIDDLDIPRLDTSTAVELSGNARVFSTGTRLFTGSAEEPVIQRWIPLEDGSLAPGDRMSLATFGLSAVPYGHNFLGPTQAYLYEGAIDTAIVWDPTTLTITGEIDLAPLRDELDLPPVLDPGVLRDDGRLFALVQQYDFATGAVFRGVKVAVFDTTTDTLEAVISDPRCVGGFTQLRVGDDGTIYAMGDNYLVLHWFDETLPPTCVVRIPPAAAHFDPDWFLDLNAVTGHPSTGLVVADGAFYTQAMDASLTDVDPTLEPLGFLNEPASVWWRIPIDDFDAAAPVQGIDPVSPRSGGHFVVDGATYIQGATDGFVGLTRLYRLDGDVAVRTFDYTGLVASLGRLTVQGEETP